MTLKEFVDQEITKDKKSKPLYNTYFFKREWWSCSKSLVKPSINLYKITYFLYKDSKTNIPIIEVYSYFSKHWEVVSPSEYKDIFVFDTEMLCRSHFNNLCMKYIQDLKDQYEKKVAKITKINDENLELLEKL